MKGNDPLPKGKVFCGANSDIVSNAFCLLTFPNLLYMKTKSSDLLPQMLSGYLTWFLRSLTFSGGCLSVIGSLGLHLFFHLLP